MAAKYKGPKRPEPGQEGLTAMLDGEKLFLKPEGFDEIHDRHGTQHRLKDENKWKPLGIGPGEDK
jgi:lysine 2,3-aminomutase